MKRLIAFLLVLLLTASCAAAAVVPSGQSLKVDGTPVSCEKYNYDGRNYFRLRDIAALLNGTSVQFSVDWDAQAQTVSLQTGTSYTPNGTELDANAPDKSATSVYSSQIIKVNGQTVHWMTVLNIGGSNFFQLRELGEVLGFTVDYDEAENTALILSQPPAKWRMTKQTVTRSDSAMTTTVLYVYDGQGRLTRTTEANDYIDPAKLTEYAYDEKGNLAAKRVQTNDGTASSVTDTAFTYDERGNLLEEASVMRYASDPEGTVRHKESLAYTYGDDGKIQTRTVTSDQNSFVSRYSYSSDGRLSRIEPIKPETPISIPMTYVTYSYDNSGRVILEGFYDDAYGSYSTSYGYEGSRLVSSATTGAAYPAEFTDYEYDEHGNEIRRIYTGKRNGKDVTIVTVTEYEVIPT